MAAIGQIGNGSEGESAVNVTVFKTSDLYSIQKKFNGARINAGVIIAQMVGANQLLVDALAGLFLLARILYGVFYIKDMDMARSLSWLTGLLCTLGFFVAATWAT